MMADSPPMTAAPSMSNPVSHLLAPHLPHPTISRSNLSPRHLSAPLPTPQLAPPPTHITNHRNYHRHHHHHHHHPHHHPRQVTSTHLPQPTFSSRQLPSPQPSHTHTQLDTPHHLTNSHLPSLPTVLSSQSSLPRQLCNPIPNHIPSLHHTLDLRHRLHPTDDHRRPETPRQPQKYRRLESTSHVSSARRVEHSPISRPLLSVIKTQYETVSARDDGYSTGSRETAAGPDGLDDENEVEAPYTCAHCAARFTDREQRKMHIKAAHGKPFVCTSCQSRFTRKFDLEKHSLTVHEGMRPYHCDVCSSCFGQKHHLVRHKRAVHAKERDFACDSCSSRFARKEHLGNHKRAVHEKNKPYVCSMCDVQYYERRALRRHLEQNHNVKSTRAPAFVEWQPNGGGAPSIKELMNM